MKKILITTISMIFFPYSLMAKPLDCHSWPMSMAEVWMKNAGIVDIVNLDESKTEIKLLASDKKEKDLYTQVYHFIFHDKQGNTYQIITKNDASSEECSMSEVNSYLISKSNINY